MKQALAVVLLLAVLAAGCGRTQEASRASEGGRGFRQERVSCQPGSVVVVDGQTVECPEAGEILVVQTQGREEDRESARSTVEVPWWYFLFSLFDRDHTVVYEPRYLQALPEGQGQASRQGTASPQAAGATRPAGPGLPDWVKAPANPESPS